MPDEPSYSSPACYMHELDDAGNARVGGLKTWNEIRDWRKRTREALISGRLALGVSKLQAKGAQAKQKL